MSTMKWLLLGLIVLSSLAFGGEIEDFVVEAKKKHGEFGEKAARFLVDGMPKSDRETLKKDFLNILNQNLQSPFQMELRLYI